jgi:glycerol dehydrogenase-like iron-containing ADH family enzyme
VMHRLLPSMPASDPCRARVRVHCVRVRGGGDGVGCVRACARAPGACLVVAPTRASHAAAVSNSAAFYRRSSRPTPSGH